MLKQRMLPISYASFLVLILLKLQLTKKFHSLKTVKTLGIRKSLIISLTRNSMKFKRNNKKVKNSKTPKMMTIRDSMGKERAL